MRKTIHLKRLVCLTLCVMLIAVTALTTGGCDLLQGGDTTTTTTVSTTTTTTEPLTKPTTGPTLMGKGETVFYFKVVDDQSNTTAFAVKTDDLYVGEALFNLGLIDGEQGAYGLFVTEVNGTQAASGTYWMFYVNGELASTGVDSTEIVQDAHYEFRMEKA